MNKYQEMYKSKLTSTEEIASQINSGDVCASACALGEPLGIVDALAERALKEDLKDIEHHLLLTLKDNKYLRPELEGKIKHVSWFTSGFSRKAVQEGRADFMPTYYKDAPMLWEEYVKADVFYAAVSPMDKHGWFSFGVAASNTIAQMKRADKVFLEVNKYMPRAHGTGMVHISDVDLVCENHEPLLELGSAELNEKDKKIGKYIADLVPDGATIQLGIGGMPTAVGKQLTHKKDLGIHSEMFTDGFLELINAGAVTNKKKTLHPGKAISGFAAGSKELYEFLDDNPAVEFRTIDYVNDPTVIGKHDNFISVNATVEVDLLGQAASESIGTKQFSGTGGQNDFVRGAKLSKGGKSFLTTYSTAKNDTVSKITHQLMPGAHVTVTKNDVDYIVTEYGAVQLKGKTAAQRAKALISIAHPKFRDELTREAKKLNLMI